MIINVSCEEYDFSKLTLNAVMATGCYSINTRYKKFSISGSIISWQTSKSWETNQLEPTAYNRGSQTFWPTAPFLEKSEKSTPPF